MLVAVILEGYRRDLKGMVFRAFGGPVIARASRLDPRIGHRRIAVRRLTRKTQRMQSVPKATIDHLDEIELVRGKDTGVTYDSAPTFTDEGPQLGDDGEPLPEQSSRDGRPDVHPDEVASHPHDSDRNPRHGV